MSSETGGSEQAHDTMVDQVIGGGSLVRLVNTMPAYGDTLAEIDEVDGTGYEAQTVAEGDWTKSVDATERTTTLTNGVEVDFGETATDWGTVVGVVIDPDDGTDNYVLADEPDDPELTGEEYSFPAGEIEYTLGDGT